MTLFIEIYVYSVIDLDKKDLNLD